MTITSTVPEYYGDVPKRTQPQTEFNTNVQDILDYQVTLAPGINDVASEMNTTATDAQTSADDSATSAAESEASEVQSGIYADLSASNANATPYDNGTTYDTGDTVIGSDGNSYRCLVGGVIGDNPVGSVTGDWVVLTTGSEDPQIQTSSFNVAPFQIYAVDTTLGEITATLPSSALSGHVVNIFDYAGAFADFNCIIDRNGHNIMGLAEDLNLNISNASTTLIYVDAIQGWRLY